MAKEKTETKAQVTQAPSIVWRGTRTWRHDLFKLELSSLKKNESWLKYDPKLVDVEHVHFFHSTDRNGKTMDNCSPVGGHFHKVTTEVTPDGQIKAVCGPPLKFIDRKLKNGKSKREIVPVTFLNGDDDTVVTDSHVHPVSYVGSEICSEEAMKEQAKQDSEKLKKLEESRVAQAAQ